MQFAKDSVYVAFRDRLATINPARVVQINGQTRPAVLAVENEPAEAPVKVPRYPNNFELHWAAAEAVGLSGNGKRPLMKLSCTVWYRTSGTDVSGADRGRVLGTMDSELQRICSPPHTPKQDYSQPEPLSLGSAVFWSSPKFEAVEESPGELSRKAQLSVFYYPEVDIA